MAHTRNYTREAQTARLVEDLIVHIKTRAERHQNPNSSPTLLTYAYTCGYLNSILVEVIERSCESKASYERVTEYLKTHLKD